MLLSHAWPMCDQGLELADSVTIDPHKWAFRFLLQRRRPGGRFLRG
jgi:hypothetical protein